MPLSANEKGQKNKNKKRKMATVNSDLAALLEWTTEEKLYKVDKIMCDLKANRLIIKE